MKHTQKEILKIALAMAIFALLGRNSLASGDGLNANYYSQPDFTGVLYHRIDPQINLLTSSKGFPGLPADYFSVRWTGLIETKYSETYTFYLKMDDGARLWVNDSLIINAWTGYAAQTVFGQINLQVNQKYPIRCEFYDYLHDHQCLLEWESASTAREIVPQSHLYSSGSPLILEKPEVNPFGGIFHDSTLITITCKTPDAAIYYTIDNSFPTKSSILYTNPFWIKEKTLIRARAYKDVGKESDVFSSMWHVKYSGSEGDGLNCIFFTGLDTVQRIEANINFNYPLYADPAILSENFSAEFTGYLVPPETREYTFYLYADDKGKLWIDNQLVIEATQWDQEFSGTISLAKGIYYPIRLRYSEFGGEAICSVKWDLNNTKATVPQKYLYTANNLSSIKDGSEAVLENFNMLQNYPNPFNLCTKIRLALPKSDLVAVNIFNLNGQKVGTIANKFLAEGNYEFEWNAKEQSSGIYFCRLETSDSRKVIKLILQK